MSRMVWGGFLASALAAAVAVAQEGVQWVDETLSDGTSLTVVEIPTAPRQSTLVRLPFGLISDGPGRTQWAHLAEHMLIRHLDPIGVGSESMEFNGETTGNAMRLEVYCTPDHLPQALNKLQGWLNTESIDPAVLAREKMMIEQEELGTTSNNATQKWALSAWNQVVRHGATHVSVHQDVANAAASAVQDYLPRIATDASISILSVGPVAVTEVRDQVESMLAAINRRSSPPIAATRPIEEIFANENYHVTWDLDAFHYLQAYRIADDTPTNRLAGVVVAMFLWQRLWPSASDDMRFGVERGLVTPEGRWLVISASLSSDAVDPAKQAIHAVLTDLRKQNIEALNSALATAKFSLVPLPNFAQVRAMQGNDPSSKYLEANLVLGRAAVHWDTALSRSEFADTLNALTAEDLRTFVEEVFSEQNSQTLFLKPSSN